MSEPHATPTLDARLSVRVALYLLAFFAVVTLLRDARSIAVLVLTAAFLAVLGSPGMRWLTRHRVPAGIAAVLVVFVMLGALVLTGAIVTTSLADFSERVPEYQVRFDERLNAIAGSDNEQLTIRDLLARIDAGAAMRFISGLLGDLLGVLGDTFIILVIVAFMLLEAASLPARLRATFGESAEREQAIASFQQSLARYAGLKTLICLATGITVGLFTWIAGVDVPLLLGFLAFVLNYIPNIGSWLAAIPALLLSFIVFGPERALIVGIGYLAINIFVSNVVEPRLMGRGLGLSPLVVFLALLFFGWILGPVGVILAIPLVMTVRLALTSNPGTRHLGHLFQPGGALELDEGEKDPAR